MQKTLIFSLTCLTLLAAVAEEPKAPALPTFNGLAHAWNFTEDKDGKIADARGTAEQPGFDLAISGEPEIVAAPFGKAAKLNGIGDHFSFPAEMTKAIGQRYAVVMVVRFDAKQPAALFTSGKDHVRYYRVTPFDGGADNKIAACASVGGTAKQQGDVKETDLLKVGAWNVIILNGVKQGPHMKLDLYLNGVKLFDRADIRGPGSLGADIRYGLIGSDAGRNAKTLAATFDEVQLYDRSLNDREIKQLTDSLPKQ